MSPELIEIGPLPEADIGDGQEPVFLEKGHGHHRVPAPEFHAPDPRGVSADCPDRLLVEAEALAIPAGQDKFLRAIGQDDIDKLVGAPEPDGIGPDGAGKGELAERYLVEVPKEKPAEKPPVKTTEKPEKTAPKPEKSTEKAAEKPATTEATAEAKRAAAILAGQGATPMRRRRSRANS